MDRKTNGSRGNTKQKVMTRKDRKAATVAEVITGRPDLFSRQSKVVAKSGENDLNQEASSNVKPPELTTEYIRLKGDEIVYKKDGKVDIEAMNLKYPGSETIIQNDGYKVVSLVKGLLSRKENKLFLDDMSFPPDVTPEMKYDIEDTFTSGLMQIRAENPGVVVIKDGGVETENN